MGICIASFCLEKEQEKMIQWSLYDDRLYSGEKNPTKVEISTQSWSKKKTFTISHSSKFRDAEWNYAVQYTLGLLSTTGRIQFPVQFPETILIRNWSCCQGRHWGGPWLLHSFSKNPLLACTGRLKIRADKTLGSVGFLCDNFLFSVENLESSRIFSPKFFLIRSTFVLLIDFPNDFSWMLTYLVPADRSALWQTNHMYMQ